VVDVDLLFQHSFLGAFRRVACLGVPCLGVAFLFPCLEVASLEAFLEGACLEAFLVPSYLVAYLLAFLGVAFLVPSYLVAFLLAFLLAFHLVVAYLVVAYLGDPFLEASLVPSFREVDQEAFPDQGEDSPSAYQVVDLLDHP